MRRPLVLGLAASLLLVHVTLVAAAWRQARARPGGNDFASYFYATRVADGGGNPYDADALDAAGRADGTRDQVFPFLYPPPFLLVMRWTQPLQLRSAYLTWFWIDELAAVLCGFLLWKWWRPIGPSIAWFTGAIVTTLAAIPHNHVMGQANLPVLAIVLGGLSCTENEHPRAGGALVGLACMLKMSPALFVGWWALRRQWRSVAWACGTAVGLAAASFLVVAPAAQADFYLRVLPGFATGNYNGLRVPIAIFGNDSLPAFYDSITSSGTVAGALSLATSVGLLGAVGVWVRSSPRDPATTAAQVGAVFVVMLLIPAYTYEHHLVWAIPAAVAAGTSMASGSLGGRWPWLVIPALLAWAWPLSQLQSTARSLARHRWAIAGLRDLKTAALVALLLACIAATRRASRSLGGGPALIDQIQ